ncbi:MAG: dynamin family protein, partial [Firmicutes bacterium]|nr:dynamin family protein [Bacillota bacterium]
MDKIGLYFNRIDQLGELFLEPGKLPLVALAGPYNTGKSTLLNNLLDRKVSPVDIIPATRVPVTIVRGDFFTILARLADGRVKVLSGKELEAFTAGKEPAVGPVRGVEISLNHGLLGKMRLMDTPGIDAAAGNDVPPALLADADHVAYLMHQRGPGEADRKFIRKLLESCAAVKISFWINRNLGHYDGTSLHEARRVLREICGGEVQVNATDTMSPEAVERFRLFIQDRASAVTLARVTDRLQEMDRQIPRLTAAALEHENHAGFLLNFWQARETARLVVRGRNSIKTLPTVSVQIKNMAGELIQPDKKLAGPTVACDTGGASPDPAAVRGKIKFQLDRIVGDPVLAMHPEKIEALKILAGKLDREEFMVAAAGGFSTGKTTFFNALLGETLLPAENRPTTFAVTRLRHDAVKKAMVEFTTRVTIPTHHVENHHATICRHELAVLEMWLGDPALCRGITRLESVKDQRTTRLTAPEMLLEIERLKETFARVQRRFNEGRRPWKSLFKRIPLQKFAGSGIADYFEVHFPSRETLELDLESEAGRAALIKTAGSHQALRVGAIEIRHPADILRTATFVDTPGLDSVYHRHREITAGYLPRSDCFLFFLHGKHILTKPDLGTFKIISGAFNESAGGKLYIIVNFADTLDEREKERVRNYLHANLVRPAKGTLDASKIHFISALDALTGKDRIPFSRLLADLRKNIWSRRCNANYASIIKGAIDILQPESKPASGAMADHGDNQLVDDVRQVLGELAHTLAGWRTRISSLSTREEFSGFREGKQIIKKGLLGLHRKTAPCPSCRDLAGEVNAPLARLHKKWSVETSVKVTGLSAPALEKELEHLLKDGGFSPPEARNALNGLLDKEEKRM